jgi:hypothetical protein
VPFKKMYIYPHEAIARNYFTELQMTSVRGNAYDPNTVQDLRITSRSSGL